MCTRLARLTHILGSSILASPAIVTTDSLFIRLIWLEIYPSLTLLLEILSTCDSSYTELGTMSATELRTIISPPNKPPTAEPSRDDVRLDVSDERAPAGDVENQNGDSDIDDVSSPLLGAAVREENMAEMEINSLLWIKKPGNEVFKEALETWQAKDELFASRVDKKRLQSSSLLNEIYQLIGFYSVFQGVLLTAVAQSNLLICHNWWTAFFLSLLASLVTVAGVIQKYRSMLALELTISNEEASRMDCISRVQKLKQEREGFSFQKHAKDRLKLKESRRLTGLKLSSVLVIFVLLLFSALFLASIFQILCDSGISPSPSPAQ